MGEWVVSEGLMHERVSAWKPEVMGVWMSEWVFRWTRDWVGEWVCLSDCLSTYKCVYTQWVIVWVCTSVCIWSEWLFEYLQVCIWSEWLFEYLQVSVYPVSDCLSTYKCVCVYVVSYLSHTIFKKCPVLFRTSMSAADSDKQWYTDQDRSLWNCSHNLMWNWLCHPRDKRYFYSWMSTQWYMEFHNLPK